MSEEQNKTPIKPRTSPVKPKVAPKNPQSNKTVSNDMAKQQTVKPKVKPINVKTVDANFDADKEKEKKKKRRFIIWLLLLLLLLTFLGVGIYLITRIPKTEINFNLYIESEVQTDITDPDDGTVITKIQYIPGNDIPATVNIKIVNNDGTLTPDKKVFLRFKIDICVDENEYSNLFSPIFNNSSVWTAGQDGYYYYNYFCYGSENIKVCDELNFTADKENNALNGKSGIFTFTVEILEGNYSAIREHWQTSPTSWRTIVK